MVQDTPAFTRWVYGNWKLPPEALSDSSVSTCESDQQCRHGIILPLWLPSAEDPLTIAYRAAVYTLFLAYLLFGISIVTDRIITAAEVIVSQKRKVTVTLRSGEKTTILLPVWNSVIASATVGVIGTSSPEILLPLVEVIHRGLNGDELGPSVVVGSGAFHLFFITAFCLISVRSTAPKPIIQLPVFFTSAFFAIGAFVWVFLILDQISPTIIELWEALVTIAMFPIFIFVIWIVAKRYPCKLWEKCVRAVRPSDKKSEKREGSPETSSVCEEEAVPDGTFPEETSKRRRLAELMHQLKVQYPLRSQAEIEEIAQEQLLVESGKSAAFYRLQTTKAFSGSSKVKALESREKSDGSILFRTLSNAPNVQVVGFCSSAHMCHESCGTTHIIVSRGGAGLADSTLTVDYTTKENTAKEEVNFQPTTGKLKFETGQSEATIAVTILGDDIYHEIPKCFEVKLSNAVLENIPPTLARLASAAGIRRLSRRSTILSSIKNGQADKVIFATDTVEVSILDDDHCGAFSFESDQLTIPDNIDKARIRVLRSIGTKGHVLVGYKITPGTAKANSDYFVAKSKDSLYFADGQTEAAIEIRIIDKDRFGEVHDLFIELQPPKKFSSDIKATIGNPLIGDHRILRIGICEDEEMQQMLDRLIKVTDIAEYFKSMSWKAQLANAFVLFHDEESKASCRAVFKTCIIHAISFPWKLLVAVMPPVKIWNGWLAYCLLLCLMGLIAALVGDCAAHLGCTIGLKDMVTATTLIPIGLCLPDLFASRRAAIHEETADAAIGQITMSSAVTVFLGMGMAWTLGAAYRTAIGDVFQFPPSKFGFSVILYCTFATGAVLVLFLRRLPPIRGELGGPVVAKILSALFFITLWILFVVLWALESYCYL